jgi:membrane dipeptidase
MLGLAHYGPSHYAGGTGTDLGVSDAGFALLQEMQERGVALDLTHLSDDQIRAVSERGGVIGVALDNWMLTPGWVKGVSRREGVGLRHCVDHIVYLRDLLGSVDAIGIGTDLDGGFGTEQCPEDLDTIADLRKLDHLLAERDVSPAEREAVLHGSWVAWLRGWF